MGNPPFGQILGCVLRQVNVKKCEEISPPTVGRAAALTWNPFYGHIYACMIPYWLMKRTALFLKELQLKKLQKLSEKTGAPVAELVRRAIDAYLHLRQRELR